MKKTGILIILISTLCFKGIGQESINSGGGIQITDHGEILYSIGEIFCCATNTMHEGVLASYEIETIDVKSEQALQGISVFPNPVEDNLHVEIENNIQSKKLNFILYGIDGVLKQSDKITTEKTHIDMAHLMKGTYILTIADEKGKTTSFKIIKK